MTLTQFQPSNSPVKPKCPHFLKMSKSHIAVSHCFAIPLFASHPWLCTLQLLDSSCSPGGSCRWSCRSWGHRPDRTRPHPGTGPPLGETTDVGRRREGRTETTGCHSPSHWYSPTNTIFRGHSQMNPICRSLQWWEQPPLLTAHSFWSAGKSYFG